MLQNYISYFSKCYQADNRDFGVLNFFSSKYECQHLLKKEELTNDRYPIQFILEKHAKEIEQTLALYSHDKELIYGTLFCIGKRSNFQKRTSSIAAPLFYYDASLIKKDGFYLKIDHDSRQINTSFLKSLDYRTSFDIFYIELEAILNRHPFIDFEFLSVFKKLLQKHIINLEEETILFPKLKTQSFLKKKLQGIKELEKFELHAASGVFISSKANNNDAVVNELELLNTTTDFSSGLKSFFSKEIEINNPVSTEVKTPILLNKSQEKVVFNAAKYQKSIIFGPPGTGKTYTISAIAQDYITRGKSVLIVTKTSQALDVIEEKLSTFKLSKAIVKVGGNYYRRRILSHLKKISNGFYYKYSDIKELKHLKWLQDDFHSQLILLEKQFSKKIDKENTRVERLFSDSFLDKLLHKIDLNWLKAFEVSEYKIIEEYFKVLKDYETTSDTYVFKSIFHKIVAYSNSDRIELMNLINAIETQEKSLKSKYLQELNSAVLLRFSPIWLVKVSEISQGLPMTKEMFDVVIVDEATQCDIASCLPIFQRAKKIVIAGDTNQLRHISFLSVSQMLGFQKKFNIPLDASFNYRKKSLLEFALDTTSQSKQITLLDEHYRSLPEIIEFSNKQFYSNSLRIMTQTPFNKDKKAVFIEQTNGEHLKNGTNAKEASYILQKIKEILLNEENLIDSKATSIGVLSPFREQTNYLGKLIKSEIELSEIKKHKIRLGTPYHFQGEERDIMLISIAADNNSHHASFNYLNRSDVFNVTITRARHQQYIYISLDKSKLNSESLLYNYLNSFNSQKQNTVPTIFSDTFSNEIIEYLHSINLKTYLGYNIAGLSIDILIEKDNNYLGIDLIGYPGSFKEAFSLERYKIMRRVNIPIFPISYISWKYRKNELKRDLILKVNQFLKNTSAIKN